MSAPRGFADRLPARAFRPPATAPAHAHRGLVAVVTSGSSALRRAACFMLACASALLASARTADAQVWHANPSNPVYCGIPRTIQDQGIPFELPLMQSIGRMIQFEVPIAPGVHERFDVEFVAVTALHQFPAGTTDPIAAFFQANPQAHFAYRYDPIALINDCDGDGRYDLGAGNPPCWGAPSANLRPDVVPAQLPADIRSSTPFNCNPRPTFIATVTAPPLLNGGVIGIRIRGHNAGLFMGASTVTWQTWPSPYGHAWVQWKSVRSDCDPQIPGPCRIAVGKYPRQPGYRNPGELRDDTNRMADFTLWYPVTTAQYVSGLRLALAQMPPNRCRDFHGCTDNCVVFVREIFSAAGLWLPDTVGHLGCPCPRKLKQTFHDMLLNGIRPPDCGYIVSGNQFQDPPIDPNGFDMDLTLELLGSHPEVLATQLGMPFVPHELGSVKLGTGGTLVFDLDFSNDVAVMIDYGDGTIVRAVPGANPHTYGGIGSYEARVSVFTSDEIRTHELLVSVSKRGNAKASRSLAIADGIPQEPNTNPPVIRLPEFPQTFEGDVNRDWTVNGDDLAMVLASWGSTGASPDDIDGDGAVNGNDLAIVLAGWGLSAP